AAPYEKDGCWTGSGLEVNGEHYLYYSTNVDGRLPQQQPMLAVSRDGKTYLPVSAEPLIQEATPDGHTEMRDPKVFIRDGVFYMLQGATRRGRGEIVGYSSMDGLDWEYRGVFYSSEKWMGDMLECPDFFTLDGVDCLLFSPMNWIGHSNVLLTGKADFETFTFTLTKVFDLDAGSDFYAAQTLPHKDGGILLVGWLGNWGKPHPECGYGWGGMLTLPRRLRLDPDTRRLMQMPAKELETLRNNEYKTTLVVGTTPVSLPEYLGNHMEVRIRLSKNFWKTDVLYIDLGNAGETALTFSIDMEHGIIQIDKTMATQGDNSIRTLRFSDGHDADELELRLFWDGSACELFIGDGGIVISERLYPVEGEPALSFYTRTEKHPLEVCAWSLESIYQKIIDE
ncbi:MAG TPA: glycoside hydrolase family 32 protein, partial [Candidatus Pelethocola excrementipullorum]|nr:glycoside hydrolase family 32 protein [Candidatus Pelethocola excrementipullorum]